MATISIVCVPLKSWFFLKKKLPIKFRCFCTKELINTKFILEGHFAYIDSSSRANGSHAQLSSPTFTKSASESDGCVQFYYHMYGADIGRLSVVVYDNTNSGGVVTSFERIGNSVYIIDMHAMFPYMVYGYASHVCETYVWISYI